MTAVDWIVLLLLAVAVALVIRRNLRKGVPCEGGGSCCGACAACRRGRTGRCPVAHAASNLERQRNTPNAFSDNVWPPNSVGPDRRAGRSEIGPYRKTVTQKVKPL